MLKGIPVKGYAAPGTPCCCASGRITAILRDAARRAAEPASDEASSVTAKDVAEPAEALDAAPRRRI
jgi:hypothetical protein